MSALNAIIKMDKKSFETVLDEIRKVTSRFVRQFNHLVMDYRTRNNGYKLEGGNNLD